MAKITHPTREQTEKAIKEYILGAWKTYKRFNPDGDLLSMTVLDNTIMFWDDPNQVGGTKIDFHENI